MSVAPKIELTSSERETLGQWIKGHRTEVRLVQRAEIVLKAAEGFLNKDISRVLGIPQNKVGRWLLMGPPVLQFCSLICATISPAAKIAAFEGERFSKKFCISR